MVGQKRREPPGKQTESPKKQVLLAFLSARKREMIITKGYTLAIPSKGEREQVGRLALGWEAIVPPSENDERHLDCCVKIKHGEIVVAEIKGLEDLKEHQTLVDGVDITARLKEDKQRIVVVATFLTSMLSKVDRADTHWETPKAKQIRKEQAAG